MANTGLSLDLIVVGDYLLGPERRHHVDEPVDLALHGLYEVLVAVPEDTSQVPRLEVQVGLAVGVPDPAALASRHHVVSHGEGLPGTHGSVQN